MGNKKATRGVLLTAARVPLGNPFTLKVRDEIRGRLLSTGFIQKAVVNWEVAKNKPHSVVLFITVKEKISWFIAPMFSYSDGQYGGSLAFGDRNLVGKGKQLRFYAGYGNETQKLQIRYRDPNIAFSPWSFNTYLTYSRSRLKEFDPTPEGIRRATLLRQQTYQLFQTGLEFGYRWFDWVNTSVGYRFGLVDMDRPLCLRSSPLKDALFQRCPTGPDGLSVAPDLLGRSYYVGPMAVLQDNGVWTDSLNAKGKFWDWRRDAAVVLKFGISRLRDIHAMRDGFAVDGDVNIANRNLGGSFDYVTWRVRYYQAVRFLANPTYGARMNLEWQVEHAQTHGAPYFKELRAGGTDVRGYASQQFVGDVLTRSRVQFKVHMFSLGWFLFRAVAFWDAAWIFRRDGGHETATLERHPTHLRFGLPGSPGSGDGYGFHSGFGVGLRVYIKGISMGTIGVDVAYGIGTNRPRFIVMIGT